MTLLSSPQCFVKMLNLRVCDLDRNSSPYQPLRSDEGLTLETSTFLPFEFTVANLRFQRSCEH